MFGSSLGMAARFTLVALVLVATIASFTWSTFASSQFSSTAPATTRVDLPLRSFRAHRESWPKYQRLIVVPGHAIQVCTEQGKSVLDPSCWLMMQ